MTSSLSKSGASTSSVKAKDKVSAYLSHHKRVCFETIQGLLSTWLTSLMTWMVIGIALGLPALMYLLLLNVSHLGSDWDGQPRISVYLDGQSEQQALALRESLLSESALSNITYISSEDALAEFTASAGLGDVLASLPGNPLPAVLELELANAATAEVRLLVSKLEDMPGVASVAVDLEWLERLFALLALGETLIVALAAFLGLGVILAIGNTIRLAIQNRRAEIEVIKLVGGTDPFVRRPFLYLGFWYGFGGALMAWLLVQISLLALSGPVDQLLNAYQHQYQLQGLGFGPSVYLFLVGSALGVGGAALAVGRHLQEIEPV